MIEILIMQSNSFVAMSILSFEVLFKTRPRRCICLVLCSKGFSVSPILKMLKGCELLAWLSLLAPSFVNGAALVGPVVHLDSGTFTGISAGGVSQFLGIPYAQPP